MPRVIGVDPGTLSFDVVGLEDGRLFLDATIATGDLARMPTALAELLLAHAPLDLVAGPSGYGLPLRCADAITGVEIGLMLLSKPGGERTSDAAAKVTIGGMRRMIAALRATGLPVIFLPGVIHLPTVPAHRKANKIDMGTADKVCVAALAVADQAQRLALAPDQTSFILVELGGAFSAALAVDSGRIVDGVGGTSGGPGFRGSGALDAELACLLGDIPKELLFTAGVRHWHEPPATAPANLPDDAFAALVEATLKNVAALLVSVPAPRELLLSGRFCDDPRLRPALEARLAPIAPLRSLECLPGAAAKHAAQGAAILADGLAGGPYAPVVRALELHAARGTVLDYLFVPGAAAIRTRFGLTAEPER